MNYSKELKRKSFHQLSLLIPIGYVIFSKTVLLLFLIPITVLFVAVDIARFTFPLLQKQFVLFFGFLLRAHEIRHLTGSSYLLLGAAVTIVLFPKDYAILSILFLIISDTAAALIGKRFGKHRIMDKSMEGTAAFFVSAMFIALLYPGIPTTHALAAAAIAALIELLPSPIDDNFLIPVATCSVIWLVFL